MALLHPVPVRDREAAEKLCQDIRAAAEGESPWKAAQPHLLRAAAQADKGRCSDVRLVGGEEQKPMSTPGAAAACSAGGLLSPPAQGRVRWLREKRDAVRSTEI